MKALLPPALALVVLLNSCDSGGRPVPRPEGYPRIALYEAVYRNDSIGPVIFESNAGTAVTERRQGADGTGWLTLAYPRYGATLYLTASPATASTLGGIIDNRLERISLNIGGATTELTELTGKGGWHGRVTLTPSGSATPLQILATSPRATALSAERFSSKERLQPLLPTRWHPLSKPSAMTLSTLSMPSDDNRQH